jgi:hypothetical protein
LQRRQRLLRGFGQTIDDEGEHLARLHDHALHVAEFTGNVFRGADLELLLELLPPRLVRRRAAHLQHAEREGSTDGEPPHQRRSREPVTPRGPAQREPACRTGRRRERARRERAAPQLHSVDETRLERGDRGGVGLGIA